MQTTNYGALGAKIELNMTQPERETFWRTHWQSTDTNMANLATFCRFKFNAVRARLKGDIENATTQEANAETCYERCIDRKHRW